MLPLPIILSAIGETSVIAKIGATGKIDIIDG